MSAGSSSSQTDSLGVIPPPGAESLDMDSLMRVLVTPMPLGRVRNQALQGAIMEAHGAAYFDPAKALSSTMRALYVIKQVGAREDGAGAVTTSCEMGS